MVLERSYGRKGGRGKREGEKERGELCCMLASNTKNRLDLLASRLARDNLFSSLELDTCLLDQ